MSENADVFIGPSSTRDVDPHNVDQDLPHDHIISNNGQDNPTEVQMIQASDESTTFLQRNCCYHAH